MLVADARAPDPMDREARLAAASTLVATLRPQGGEGASDRLDELVVRLEADPALRARLAGTLGELLAEVEAVETLAAAGVLGDEPLLAEVLHRLVRRVLPPVDLAPTLAGLVRRLFTHPGDAAWLAAVPPATWARLQDALGLRLRPEDPIPPELERAIRVIAHRIAALGLRPVLTRRVPELGLADSPFLALSDEVLAYVRTHGNGEVDDELPRLEACLETLGQCRAAVDRLRANRSRYGTSLELTALSFRMLGLVDRLELLLRLTDPRGHRRG